MRLSGTLLGTSALILLTLSPVLGDEKGDQLVRKVEEKVESLEPLAAEYTITYKAGASGGFIAFDCTAVKTSTMNAFHGGGSHSGGDGAALFGQRNPLSLTLFDVMPGGKNGGVQITATKYLGPKIVGGVTYETVEVKGSVPDPWHGHPPPGQITLTEATMVWYVAEDGLIHRITFTPDLKKALPDVGVKPGNLAPGKPANDPLAPVNGLPPSFSAEVEVSKFRKAITFPPRQDAPGKHRVVTHNNHGQNPMSVAESSGHDLIAVGYFDGSIDLLDAGSGELKSQLTGHVTGVNHIVFSRDGKVLASASSDGVIGLWDTHSGMLMRTVKPGAHPAASIAFSPDGSLLAVAEFDSSILIHKTISGEKVALPAEMKGTNAVFSPDGKLLATAKGGEGVKLWETSHWTLTQKFPLTLAFNSTNLLFSANSELLVVANPMTELRVFSTTSGKLVHELEGANKLIGSLTFSPDGKTLIAVDTDTRGDLPTNQPGFMLWDTSDWKQVAAYGLSQTPFLPMFEQGALCLSSSTLTALDVMRQICVWDVPVR